MAQELQFEQRVITIKLRYTKTDEETRKAVPAQVAVGTGLAYHLHEPNNDLLSETWVITHIASGYRVGSSSYPDFFLSENDAKTALQKIAPLTDWNKSQAEIHRDVPPGFAAKLHGIFEDVEVHA